MQRLPSIASRQLASQPRTWARRMGAAALHALRLLLARQTLVTSCDGVSSAAQRGAARGRPAAVELSLTPDATALARMDEAVYGAAFASYASGRRRFGRGTLVGNWCEERAEAGLERPLVKAVCGLRHRPASVRARTLTAPVLRRTANVARICDDHGRGERIGSARLGA